MRGLVSLSKNSQWARISSYWKITNTFLLSNSSNLEKAYFHDVLDAINNAKRNIHIVTFWLKGTIKRPNRRPNVILNTLVDAKNRGVDVKVILDGDFDPDGDGIPSAQPAMNYLRSNGIPVKYDERDPPRTHIKMAIIDDDTVFVGSHNWMDIQLRSSNEATVKSPFIVDDAVSYFNWKWDRGRIPP